MVAATDPSVLLLIQANPSIHPTTQSLALILDLKNSNLRTNTNNFHGSPAIQFKCITRWANTLHPLPPPHIRDLKKFRGPRQAHLFTISTRQQRLRRFISPTTYLAETQTKNLTAASQTTINNLGIVSQGHFLGTFYIVLSAKVL